MRSDERDSDMNWLVNQFTRELERKWTEFTLEMMLAIAEEKMRIRSDKVETSHRMFQILSPRYIDHYRRSPFILARAALFILIPAGVTQAFKTKFDCSSQGRFARTLSAEPWLPGGLERRASLPAADKVRRAS
jgi:hypothetical protein